MSSLFNLKELKNQGGFKAGDLLAVDPKLYSKFLSINDLGVNPFLPQNVEMIRSSGLCHTAPPLKNPLKLVDGIFSMRDQILLSTCG